MDILSFTSGNLYVCVYMQGRVQQAIIRAYRETKTQMWLKSVDMAQRDVQKTRDGSDVQHSSESRY